MSREPRRDWRAELGRHEGRAAHEALSDQVTLFRIVFRLLTFPFWFPLYLRRVERRRREMMEFAMERVGDRAIGDELVKEITLAWVAAHEDRYPLGEYDPRLRKLHRTFESMLVRRLR